MYGEDHRADIRALEAIRQEHQQLLEGMRARREPQFVQPAVNQPIMPPNFPLQNEAKRLDIPIPDALPAVHVRNDHPFGGIFGAGPNQVAAHLAAGDVRQRMPYRAQPAGLPLQKANQNPRRVETAERLGRPLSPGGQGRVDAQYVFPHMRPQPALAGLGNMVVRSQGSYPPLGGVPQQQGGNALPRPSPVVQPLDRAIPESPGLDQLDAHARNFGDVVDLMSPQAIVDLTGEEAIDGARDGLQDMPDHFLGAMAYGDVLHGAGEEEPFYALPGPLLPVEFAANGEIPGFQW